MKSKGSVIGVETFIVYVIVVDYYFIVIQNHFLHQQVEHDLWGLFQSCLDIVEDFFPFHFLAFLIFFDGARGADFLGFLFQFFQSGFCGRGYDALLDGV